MSRTPLIIICLFYFFFLSKPVEGQKVEALDLVQIDISDGLSENIVISLHEDREGYIWVGTYDGLNKFDGYYFKTYREEFLNNPNASNNRFYEIRENSEGKLWLYKDEGSYLFDPYTEKVIDYKTAKDATFNFIRNAEGEPISYDASLLLFLEEEHVRIIGSLQGEKDRLCLMTNNGGLIIYEERNKEFQYYKPETEKGRNFLSYCLVGTEIWVGSKDGHLLKFDLSTNSYSDIHNELSNQKVIINVLYHDKNFHKVWIATQNNGLICYDYLSKVWTNYDVKVPGKNALTSETVVSLIRDSRDVLWLGTEQHGLLVHDPYQKKFKAIDPDRYNIDFDIRMPRKIMGDSYGNIWIGSNNLGLWKYNVNEDELDLITKETNPSFMQDNSAIQLLSDENKLYIGHNGSGLDVIDIPTMTLLEKIPLISQDIRLRSGTVIWNIFKDELNRIWVGTRSSGIYIIDKEEILHLHSFNTNLTHNEIQTIDQGNDGEIIVSTRLGGIYEWREEQKNFFKKFPKDSTILAPKSVSMDKEGFLWIGTDGKGLFILDKEYNLVAKANVENKMLGSDVTCSFIEDDNGTMWVSTNFGLSKIDFNSKSNHLSQSHFSKYDGLLSDEFMTGAYYKTGGTLWMGNISGINYFDADNLGINPHKPKVRISNVEVYRNEIETDTSINYLSYLNLKRGEKSLSIEFNTLGYTVPENTLYSYRLKGYDDSWSAPNKRTFISYTNLEPGNYQFEVKAANYDGLWNDEATTLNFRVRSIFLESKLFRIILLLGLFSLALLFYRFRVKQIREKVKLTNRYNKDLSQMEMKALRAQINPHFLFNTLNSINNYILQNEGDIASHYLVKFSQLMRIILSNSESSFITLEDEMNALNLYIELEGMRFANNFDYFLNVDPNINTEHNRIPPMLLQPFVENAIWHGLMHNDGDNCLEIDISPYKDLIKVSIKDNGIGRAAAQTIRNESIKRKSYGMDITKKRIELINKVHNYSDYYSSVEVIDLVDDEGKAEGTIVNVYIPKISKNKFQENEV